MALLMDLPNELLEKVVSNTYREDLVNFAITSKRIHALARSALERHRELQAEYSGVFDSHSDSGVLARLVVNIIQDPRIGCYVTDLAIRGWNKAWMAEYQGSGYPEHDEYPEITMSCLREAIRNKPYLTDEARVSWLMGLEKGDEEPLIALLFSLLPNLSKLTINTSSHLGFEEIECLRLQFALDEVLETPSRSLLSKLHTVELKSGAWNAFDTFRRLIQIPSLRIMRAAGLLTRNYDTPLMHASIERSGIRTLILDHCDTGTKAIASAIESIKSLECFSYLDMTDHAAETQPDPYWIRVSLLANARDTLRFFQYFHRPVKEDSVLRNITHRYLCSLRGFRALETIVVDHLLLFSNDLQGHHTFATELPRSSRNLLLHVGNIEDFSEDDSSLSSSSISEDSDERQQTNQVPSGTKRSIRGAAETPSITAPALKLTLQRLLDEKEQYLPHLSNLRILGLDEEVVREVSSSGLVEKFLANGIDFSMAARDSAGAKLFVHRIQNYGFHNEKPWYHEDMDG